MSEAALPGLALVVPLLMAAVLVGAAPVLREPLAGWLAVLAAGVSVACTAMLLLESSNGMLVYWFGGWQPRDGTALGVSFTIDALGAAMAVFASVLVTAALVYGLVYFQAIGNLFYGLVLVFLAAMIGYCLTGDIFNMFVFFELMSVAAYALTGYQIEERGPIQGALNFAVSNSLGAFLILYGIGLLYGRTGALNLAQIGRQLTAQPPDELVIVAFVLIGAGLTVKAAVVPFHFWLADAHAVAPTPVCVLFSGVMVQLGLFGFLRIFWTVFAAGFEAHADGVRGVLFVAGVVTALVGGVMCYLQRHIKRLLAYSTISHVGAFVLGAGSLTSTGLAGTALYVLGHGLVKGALFMIAGVLLNRFSSVDEISLTGRGRPLWPAGVVFGLGGLALAGAPFFLTATGKSLVEQGYSGIRGNLMLIVLEVSSILTGGAVLRTTGRVFLGIRNTVQDAAARAPTRGEEEREGREQSGHGIPLGMLAPAAILMAGAIVLGVVHTPLGQVESAALRFVDQPAYISAVMDGQPARLHTAVEEVRPSGGALAWGLVSTCGALALAAVSLGVVSVPRAVGDQAVQLVESVAGPLRRLHSGHVGDYAAWLLLGTVLLGAAYSAVLR